MDAGKHVQVVTHVADTISAGAIVMTWLGFLPPIAAFAATVWYLVQIWESHTVQRWYRLYKRKRKTVPKKRKSKHVRKLARAIQPPEL